MLLLDTNLLIDVLRGWGNRNGWNHGWTPSHG
jgi:hypothetical protein